MSTLAEKRAAIAATISGVANTGQVHDYERYAKAEGEFRALYQADIGASKSLRGWFVRRVATREVSVAVGVGMEVIGWRITGYLAIDDAAASEKTFDDLIEALRAAFRTDPTLGGVVADLYDLTQSADSAPYGLQVEESGPVLFAGVLCHRAVLGLVTSSPIHF